MKSAFALLLCTSLFVPSVHASDLFLGRFAPDPEHCNGWLAKAKRVYASFGQDGIVPPFVKTIRLQAYGQETQLEEILLGDGKRQLPGTIPSVHGKVTQRWKTTVSGNILKSAEVIVRSSTKQEWRSYTQLTDFRKGMNVYIKTQVKGQPAQAQYCRLVRY